MLRVPVISISEDMVRLALDKIGTKRLRHMLQRAMIAHSMDSMDITFYRDDMSSGDEAFKPKDEWERMVWMDIREQSKKQMRIRINHRKAGTIGGAIGKRGPAKRPGGTETP